MKHFSIIIPVYNRPTEVQELLESLTAQTMDGFEVVIVEDGSTLRSDTVAAAFADRLNIQYFCKENSGPGDSRNFGMQRANGNYFLILDSDCILPPNYMETVNHSLHTTYADCFGGVDTAMDAFTDIQKAINFAMTSVLTTGGVRGGSEKLGKFQPRSFNMGISKEAFEASGGFGRIHPGEDPDLAMRLWKLGYETRLFQNVKVFHKRRIDWEKFYLQVYKFGKVRPILNEWHPEYAKLTYYFPAAFLVGLVGALLFLAAGNLLPIAAYAAYFILCFMVSTWQNKSLRVGYLSVRAVATQFLGYGRGFLEAVWQLKGKGKSPETAFPELFFAQPSAKDDKAA